MKKYIIGLGCSWTQGEGGYPEHIWKQYNGRVQLRGVDDHHLRQYEHENSWVNVLCRDHFQDHIPVNLGVRGIGNRAAVHQLHFCDIVDWNNATGIIVLMLSGFERYDFVQRHPLAFPPLQDDYYSNLDFRHYKWRTSWPFEDAGGAEQPLWKVYANMLWSEDFVALSQMLALLDLQTFAKAHNFKVVLANAWNYPHDLNTGKPLLPTEWLSTYTRSMFNKFDWSCYIHNETDYLCFMQKLVEIDGLIEKEHWNSWYNFYNKRDWPSKYLTNCDGAHPTLEGYKVIGDEIAKFIRSRGYA